MNEILDPILGWTLSRVGDVATSSWGAYRMLFTPGFGEAQRDWLCRKRAAAAFFNARRTVPAYQEFLRQHGAEHPKAFEDIPPMDKETYIKKWAIEALCQGGRLPLRGAVIDESSGSSGTASNWVRGNAERTATRRLIQYSARSTFGDDSFVLLNCFALGPWATGMNVSMSLVDRCVLKSIGPDAAKVVATLKFLGPKYRYVYVQSSAAKECRNRCVQRSTSAFARRSRASAHRISRSISPSRLTSPSRSAKRLPQTHHSAATCMVRNRCQ
jgi:phenylacetate-CoA ligase